MIEDSKGGSRARQVHCRDMGCQPNASDLSRRHALLDLTLKPGVNGLERDRSGRNTTARLSELWDLQGL